MSHVGYHWPMNILRNPTLRESLYDAAGRWSRFTGYEVRDGYIRPAPGATLETYDPWEAFEASRAARASELPAYVQLIELAKRIEKGAEGRRQLVSTGTPGRGEVAVPMYSDEDKRAIERWCSSWGLLGILPHFARKAVLAPRWEPAAGFKKVVDPQTGTTEMRPFEQSWLDCAQRVYTREGHAWRTARTMNVGGPSTAPKDAVRDGLVPAMLVPKKWPRPSADIEDSPAIGPGFPTDSTSGPLDHRWAHYFPAVKWSEVETFPYPAPLSESFWHSYAERVFDFFHHGRLFGLIWDNILPGRPDIPGMVSASLSRARCRGYLHSLLLPVSHVLHENPDGSLGRLRVSPSLLGSLALMMFEDLGEGRRRVRRCAACVQPFRVVAVGGAYCSERCRRTVGKRKYRARQQGRITTVVAQAGIARKDARRVAVRLESRYQTLVRLRRAAVEDEATVSRFVQRALAQGTARDVRRVVRRLATSNARPAGRADALDS